MHLLAGLGPLDGNHREFVVLGHRDLEARGLPLEPGQALVAGGRVDHHAEPLRFHEVGDQVVDNPAVLVEHAAVQRFPVLLQAAHVVGQEPQQEIPRLGAADVDHGHVRDVEHARGGAHLVVLVDLRPVVDRQGPADEVDHARPGGQVCSVKRRVAHVHASASATPPTAASSALRSRVVPSGSSRNRLPVAAKSALATAGAIGGTPGSPTPAGGASLSTR